MTAPRDGELSYEQVDACPVCDGRERTTWGEVRDHEFQLSELRFPASRCVRCQAIFLGERLAADSIGVLYPDDYSPYEAPPAPSSSAPSGVRAQVGRLRRRLERPRPLEALEAEVYEPGGRHTFLDYGCGASTFLDRMRSAGWSRTIGADFTSSVVDRVRLAGHEAHLVEDLSSIEAASVDVVRMNHVLEHLTDPDEALTSIRLVLKPGGVLHIAVPNPGGLGARLFRSSWRAAEPRHLVLFGPALLRSVVDRNGFTVERLVHEPSPRDLAGSVCYALEDRGLVGRAVVNKWRRHPVLELAALPVAAAAAGLRAGERIHCVARA